MDAAKRSLATASSAHAYVIETLTSIPADKETLEQAIRAAEIEVLKAASTQPGRPHPSTASKRRLPLHLTEGSACAFLR
jgi:hypothetical protein